MTADLRRALRLALLLRLAAMAGAAMALTVFAAWLVWLLAWRWPAPLEAARRLDILGKALWIVLTGIVVLVIALTGRHVVASGLWGRLDVSGDGIDGKDGPA